MRWCGEGDLFYCVFWYSTDVRTWERSCRRKREGEVDSACVRERWTVCVCVCKGGREGAEKSSKCWADFATRI